MVKSLPLPANICENEAEMLARVMTLYLLISLPVTAKPVRVEITVTLPAGTPSDSIYLAGDRPQVGNWQPDGLALERRAGDRARAILYLQSGDTFHYKFTRGSWGTVEKHGDGSERADRELFVDSAAPDTLVVDVRIESWADAKPPRALRVLFFQEEGADVGWYHTSNPIAELALRRIGASRDWKMTTAKQSTGIFTSDSLGRFDVIVYLLTSGTVLDCCERLALVDFVGKGGGFVGVHSASFTDPDWDWFRRLVGARFRAHAPGLQWADVTCDHPGDILLAGIPARWSRRDEWYTFTTRPEDNPSLEILLSLDESTCPADYPAELRVGRHPIAWRQTFAGGRSLYTAMGHTNESYADSTFVAFLTAGIEWAGEPLRANVRPE
jgi:type 1 glutamine amidotransferase